MEKLETKEGVKVWVLAVANALVPEVMVDLVYFDPDSREFIRYTSGEGYSITIPLDVREFTALFHKEEMRLIFATFVPLEALEGCTCLESVEVLLKQYQQGHLLHHARVLQANNVRPGNVVVPWHLLSSICSRRQLESLLRASDWPVSDLRRPIRERPKIQLCTVARLHKEDCHFPNPMMMLVLTWPELFSRCAAR